MCLPSHAASKASAYTRSNLAREDTYKVQNTPHLFNPILYQGACESETSRALYLFHSQCSAGPRLLQAMSFINNDSPVYQ